MIDTYATLCRLRSRVSGRHALAALTLACAVGLSSPASAAAAYAVRFEGPPVLCVIAEQYSELARF